MELCKHGWDSERCGWCDELKRTLENRKLGPITTVMTDKFTPEEVSLMGVSAPQILKIMRDREAMVLSKIHGEFKAGKLDQLAALAEFCTLRDLQNDITNTLRRQAAIEEKKHATDHTIHESGPSTR